MSLEKLKKCNQNRSKREWLLDPQSDRILICNGLSASGDLGYCIAASSETRHAEFIALSANMMDRLLAVVDAAELFCSVIPKGTFATVDPLIDALAALEEEK